MPTKGRTLSDLKRGKRVESGQRVRECEANRPSAAARGYGSQWRKARAHFLHKHPLCVRCKGDGLIEAATVVDHIIPHRGDKQLFWDRDNWQSLCETCHNRKTATEDVKRPHRVGGGVNT